MSKGGGAEVASKLMAYMRSGPDLAGIIPDSMIVPEEGLVESSQSGELMEKVALALDQENDRAEKAGKDPEVRRALQKAGVLEHVYLQMATHPDFQAVCKRVYTAFVLIPRWAAICRSMSKAAMTGDVAAARWVRDLIAEGDVDMEASMKAIERDGPDALKRRVGDLVLQLHDMTSKMELAQLPEDLVREAKEDVATQYHRPEPEMRLSLADWTNDE